MCPPLSPPLRLLLLPSLSTPHSAFFGRIQRHEIQRENRPSGHCANTRTCHAEPQAKHTLWRQRAQRIHARYVHGTRMRMRSIALVNEVAVLYVYSCMVMLRLLPLRGCLISCALAELAL
jgi:hypothetical protein